MGSIQAAHAALDGRKNTEYRGVEKFGNTESGDVIGRLVLSRISRGRRSGRFV
jgi:hypothetical protein